MAEREQGASREEALRQALYQRATSAEGFAITLNAQDVLSLRIAGNEVTLFIKPEPSSEVMNAQAAETARPGPEPPQGTVNVPAERENRRLHLVGRLASEPRYAPLPRKGLRVSFVVAEHLEGDNTAFHRAYATGDFARRIQGKRPHKGDEVTVDGERQTNRTRQADGSFKESEVVYCYGLRVRMSAQRNG